MFQPVLTCSDRCVQRLRHPGEAGVLPLGGASGNVPVVSSCWVFDSSPAGGKVWVQQQILVCPDVVCRDTETVNICPLLSAMLKCNSQLLLVPPTGCSVKDTTKWTSIIFMINLLPVSPTFKTDRLVSKSFNRWGEENPPEFSFHRFWPANLHCGPEPVLGDFLPSSPL